MDKGGRADGLEERLEESSDSSGFGSVLGDRGRWWKVHSKVGKIRIYSEDYQAEFTDGLDA